jgi:hypothetical protein
MALSAVGKQEGVGHASCCCISENASSRAETAVPGHDGPAEVQRGQQRIHQAAGPGPVGGRPEHGLRCPEAPPRSGHARIEAEPVLARRQSRSGCRSAPGGESARPWGCRSCRWCRSAPPGSSAAVSTIRNCGGCAAIAHLRSARIGTPLPPRPRRSPQRSWGQRPRTALSASMDASSQIASTASLSCRRNSRASGPNNMDSGMATAPICRTAM